MIVEQVSQRAITGGMEEKKCGSAGIEAAMIPRFISTILVLFFSILH